MSRSFKIAGLAALGLIVLPGLAAAQTLAVATTDLHMRAGPGSGYSVVGVIPGSHQVNVYECTANLNWCHVSYGGMSGWSYSPYLATEWHGAPHGTVAVAGPEPYDDRTYGRGWGVAPHAGIAGGALAGALIGGPPGAIIGGALGGMAMAGAGPTHHQRTFR